MKRNLQLQQQVERRIAIGQYVRAVITKRDILSLSIPYRRFFLWGICQRDPNIRRKIAEHPDLPPQLQHRMAHDVSQVSEQERSPLCNRCSQSASAARVLR